MNAILSLLIAWARPFAIQSFILLFGKFLNFDQMGSTHAGYFESRQLQYGLIIL